MIKKLLALVLALILAMSATGCESLFKAGEDEESSETESAESSTDIRPREYPVSAFDITLDSRPQTIVSLSPSVSDKLFEMGYGGRLLGISENCENGDGEMRTRCGTVETPDMDAIESISPQLLFTDAELSPGVAGEMDSLGIAVVLVEKARDLSELKIIYVTLAIMLDGEITGELVGRGYYEGAFEGRIAELSGKAQEETRNAVYVRELDHGVATGDTLESALMDVIGLDNVAGAFTDWNIPEEEANTEETRERFRSIDFIYMDNDDMNIHDMEQSEYWRGLNAVLKDQYLYIDRELFSRQSYAMLDELDKMQQYANGEIESSRSVDYPDTPQAQPQTQAPAQPQAPAQNPTPPPAPEPEATPAQGAPQEGAPQEGAPQEGAPQEGAPQEGAPQEGNPDDLGSSSSTGGGDDYDTYYSNEELGDGSDTDFDSGLDEDTGADDLVPPDDLDA